jgi:hypothetical protein
MRYHYKAGATEPSRLLGVGWTVSFCPSPAETRGSRSWMNQEEKGVLGGSFHVPNDWRRQKGEKSHLFVPGLDTHERRTL